MLYPSSEDIFNAQQVAAGTKASTSHLVDLPVSNGRSMRYGCPSIPTLSEISFQTQDIPEHPTVPSSSLTSHPHVEAQARYNGLHAGDVRDIRSAAFYGTSLSPSRSRIADAITPVQSMSYCESPVDRLPIAADMQPRDLPAPRRMKPRYDIQSSRGAPNSKSVRQLSNETNLRQSKRDHIPDSLSREQLCGEWPKHSRAPEGQVRTNQLLALREGEPQLSSPYSKTISHPDRRLNEPRISVDPVRFPAGPPQTRHDLSSQTPYSPLRSPKEPEYKSRWPINTKDISSVDSPVDPRSSFSRILSTGKRKLDSSREDAGPSKRLHPSGTKPAPNIQTNCEGQQIGYLNHLRNVKVAPTELPPMYPGTRPDSPEPRTDYPAVVTEAHAPMNTRADPSAVGLWKSRVTRAQPTRGPGFFRDAHGSMLDHMNIVEKNSYVLNRSAVLQWLEPRVLQGAELYSPCQHPLSYNPETHAAVIQKVHNWLDIPQPEKKLLWLRGPALAGRSVIVQILVENLSNRGRMGASLFFSQPHGRSDPRRVFPTLAHQFAVRDLSYATYVAELAAKDPRCLGVAMREQFQLLIVEPFVTKKVRNGSEAWVIALDGLDECGGDPNSGRHSDHVQREIVQLISEFVLRYPLVPLIWIIASRPESYLRTIFSEDDVKASLWVENVPVDSGKAYQDWEALLHGGFVKSPGHSPNYMNKSLRTNNEVFSENGGTNEVPEPSSLLHATKTAPVSSAQTSYKPQQGGPSDSLRGTNMAIPVLSPTHPAMQSDNSRNPIDYQDMLKTQTSMNARAPDIAVPRVLEETRGQASTIGSSKGAHGVMLHDLNVVNMDRTTPRPTSRPFPQDAKPPPYSPAGPLAAPSTRPTSPFAEHPTTGHFQGAHNFLVNNPTFTEYHTDVHHTHMVNKNNAMQELAGHIIEGAEFDSFARDPPPRCQPGTRQVIIRDLDEWIHNHERNLLWLRGPAGVGKSAIMQSLAEAVSESTTLGASLFFSRLNGRNNPNHIIPTLAYQLALHISGYRHYVSEFIDLHPTIFGKSMSQQFRQLIGAPFSMPHLCEGLQQKLLILIDGLDECEEERAQCELISLIASFVKASPASPFLWIIASRPEYHLQNVFRSSEIEGTFVLRDVPIDGSEASTDVERYLRTGFERIRRSFPDMVPLTSCWPSERQLAAILKAANGLFVFVAALLKFIGDDSPYGDPISQLNAVLSALDKHRSEESAEKPLASLDTLYTHILSAVPLASIPILHQILGFYLLKGHSSSAPLLLAANLLDMRQNVVYTALQRLHSVLDIPQPCDAHQRPLRFFHASFGDYLTDLTRSGSFCLDMGKQCIKIALSYIRKFDLMLETGKGPAAIPLSWVHEGESNLGMRIFREVKQNWYQILPKIFTKWDLQHHAAELEELLDALKRLRFNAFDVNDALGLLNIINWIAGGSLPAMWNRLIAEEVPLEDFNLDQVDSMRTSVYYRTKPDRWGYWTTNTVTADVAGFHTNKQHQRYLEAHLLSEQEFFEDFQLLRRNDPSLRASIVGSDPSRYCAVVISPGGKQGIKPIVRYYLPLKNVGPTGWAGN